MKKRTALIKNCITVLFLIIAVLFLVRAMKSSYAQIKAMDFSVNVPMFVFSLLIYMAYFIFLASLWHYVTVLNRSAIPYSEAITSYAFSVLGKYIPGEVFMLLARMPAYEHRGVKARKVTVNFYLESMGTFLGAAFLFLGSLFFFPNHIMSHYTPLIVALALLLMIGIHPKVINFFLRFLERFIKGKGLQITISYPQMLSVISLFVCNWILVGSGFYLLVCSIYPISPGQFLYAGGIFGLAVIIGMVAFFAPSGIGVREGILTLGLSVIVPPEFALVIALIARIWATAAELLFILAVYLISRFRRMGHKKIRKTWWKESVLYRTGASQADLIPRLDRLKDIGVNVIWFEKDAAGRDEGDPFFAASELLLTEIHARDMKALTDFREDIFDRGKAEKGIGQILKNGMNGICLELMMQKEKRRLPIAKKARETEAEPAQDNVPGAAKLHACLRELRHDLFWRQNQSLMIGKTEGMTIEDALRVANDDESECSMAVPLGYMKAEYGGFREYRDPQTLAADLKRVMTGWQTELYGKAWYCLFWDEDILRKTAAHLAPVIAERKRCTEMLLICLYLMQGTPCISEADGLIGESAAPADNAGESDLEKEAFCDCLKNLFSLRKEHEIVVYGRYYLIAEGKGTVYAYMRSYGGEKLMVVCNLAGERQSFPVPRSLEGREGRLLIENCEGVPTQTDGVYTLRPFEAFACLYPQIKKRRKR